MGLRETELSPLAAASVAKIENCFMKSHLHIRTVSRLAAAIS
jgi:hypothetical protein